MEKLVLKGKKEIRLILVEALNQTVGTLGLIKSKKKTSKVINKASRRIAELVAAQMKKELKKIKVAKVKKVKPSKADKGKKPKKISAEKLAEPVLETA